MGAAVSTVVHQSRGEDEGEEEEEKEEEEEEEEEEEGLSMFEKEATYLRMSLTSRSTTPT